MGRFLQAAIVRRAFWVGGAAVCALGVAMNVTAQTCTTQSRMTPELYSTLSGTALGLATSVKASDTAKLQSETVAEYASNFGPIAYLAQNTATKISADTLRVAQVYQLDATKVTAGSADFSCSLAGTSSETDFTFNSLPAGLYGFAMVEADGPRPWVLSFVLQQVSGSWKMAGFYSHARTAAGHDGVWYWNAARQKARDGQPWLAWLYYGEAEQLLRPAVFVTSTNLDKMLAEQGSVIPPALSDGISAQTPLVMKGSGDAEFRLTAIAAGASEDGKQLNLNIHLRAEPLADLTAARARNNAAAQAFLDAHKELRPAFDAVWVFAEAEGHDPFVTDQPVKDIP